MLYKLHLEETKESENVSVYINADTWPCVDLITSQSNQLPFSLLSESEFLPLPAPRLSISAHSS